MKLSSFKNLSICAIANFIIVSFILILSFYLICHLNGINLNNVEKFRVGGIGGGICKPVIQNKINMNALAKPLNDIATSLKKINAKLDFVNGFKTIKEGKGRYDKNPKVPRKHYPDPGNRYRFDRE